MGEGSGTSSSGTVWDPDQYERFRRERAQPFIDLLNRIPDIPIHRAADLGCGTGDLTHLLVEKWPSAHVWGVDSSAEMLRRARARSLNQRLSFVEADFRHWHAPEPLECILSNAAFQWVPNHAELLSHLASQLAPNGILAAQLPNNRSERAYRLLAEVAARPQWSGRFPAQALQTTVEPAEWYVEKLRTLGLQAEAWETIYYHQLPDPLAIVEWLKGTALRPVLSALEEQEVASFLQPLSSGMAKLYKAGPFGVIFPFRRLFFLAKRT